MTRTPPAVPDGFRLAANYGEILQADHAAFLVTRNEPRGTPPVRALRIRHQGQWVPAQIDHTIRTRRAPGHSTPPERVGAYVTGPDFPARRVAAGEIAIPVEPEGAPR